MKNFFYILILFTLFNFMSINASAAVCSDDEINRLSEQANTVEYVVELTDGDEDDVSETETYPSYLISFYNMNEDLKLVQKDGSFSSTDDMIEDGRITFRYRTLEYQEETFEIYASSDECTGKLLRTMTVTIPQYNEYANNPLCEDAQDYIYCSPTIYSDEKIEYEDFVSGVTQYKIDVESSALEVDETLLNKYRIYSYMIGLASLALVALVVFIIVRKIRK